MAYQEKVIGFDNKGPDSKVRMSKAKENTTVENNEEKISGLKLFLFKNKFKILICAIIVIAAIVIPCVLLKKGDEVHKPPQTNPKINPDKIETEFPEFKNKLREPYKIDVAQKSSEETLTNGIKISQSLYRNTIYNIYILNETYANENTKNFYNKVYTAAILITNQCIDTKNDNCEPEQMIGLPQATRRNLRSMQDIPDLKDAPLPLCLFNITDNHVITSMLCPESLNRNIRQAMILDLYFFRPPAIKRPDRKGNNVTILQETKNGKNYIYETNGGICDIPDSFESACSTEMNTTTDLEGNILTYDEIALTNIRHDDNNSYVKNKITNLKDETENLTNIDKEAYKEALEILIEKLTPYFKYYEEFSEENFKELYKVSKNITDENVTNNSRRYLQVDTQEEESSANEEELFNYRHYTDLKIFVNSLNDPGYNSDTIRAALNFKINEDSRELIGCKNNSNFKDIIKLLRDLSNSGNSLATELYNNIKDNLENLDDIIYENITSLINLIVNEETKSLIYIFDAASNMDELYFFPKKLVDESFTLKNNLDNLLTIIKNGGMKSKFSILNTEIYSFLSTSHTLMDNVFQNVRSLSNSLRSKKSLLTEISTYYLNNTPNSFNTVVKTAQDILLNYYNDEDDLIITNVSYLIGNFTEKLSKSTESGRMILDKLLKNLENNYFNISIENGNEDDKNNLISNLRDSKEIINSIILKVEELIKKEMNLKENGHFISDYEIKSNNNSYYPDVKDAMETSEILDKDETIDKDFDKTFSDFRENYTKLMLSEKTKLQEKAVFLDNILDNGLFSGTNKKYIETNISTVGLRITDSITNQNNQFLNEANKVINSFIEENAQTLKSLINDLTGSFSEDIIIDLAKLYDTAFKSILSSIENNLEKNKKLTYDYFSNVAQLFKNSSKVLDLLKSYQVSEEYIPVYLYYWSETHYVNITKFEDTVKKKSKTIGYLNKYQIFNEKMELSRDYINQQLQSELKYEYKNTITKLKELLQILKNAKISTRFSNYPQLVDIDNNLKDLDNLYKIINTYFYDEKYNNEYLPKINNLKKNSINTINYIENNIIASSHKEINKYPTVNDYSKDFCFNFYRKKTYTCTNGVIYIRDSTSDYCDSFADSKNNYNNLITLSIYSDSNIQKFSSQLKKIHTKLSNIVSTYTSLINGLAQKLYSLEQKANEITLDQNLLLDYKNIVNDILSKYYGSNIILETYNIFKSDTEIRVNQLFNETLYNWENLFSNLYNEVKNNLDKYKNSVTEFGLISIVYYNYLYTNISEGYYDLMTNHAKNEFNYAISYYYNYLLKVIKSDNQIIMSKMPTNNIGFERVIEKIKNSIEKMFSEITDNIKNSKNKDLSRYNQLYLLQVPETNFFNISYTLTNFRKEIKDEIEGITYQIYGEDNQKKNDLYSYVSRLYLENSLNGKQLNEFYKEVEDKNFVYLKLDKFEELIKNNWIFDQNSFIKTLTDAFAENNAQITNELSFKKDKYKITLKGELEKYKNFINKNITFIIDDLYSKAIKQLTENNVKQINDDIQFIVDKIVYYIKEEAERIKSSNMLYYNDFSLINQTIKDYKEKILLNMENKIKEFVDIHRKELEEKVYLGYYEKNLDSYLYYINEEIKTDENINLLNSTYNIGQIIYQLAQSIKKDLENTVKTQIKQKYEKYCDKIMSDLFFEKNKQNLETQIENSYSKLFIILKTKATINEEVIGHFSYDLGDDIKKGIDEQINLKFNTFSSIIESLKAEKYKNIDINNFIEWEKPDFSKISNVIGNIRISLIQFFDIEKKDEDNKIRSFIEETIRFNFYDLLNNLIPSFGNEFFERIISYNENFKISYLYDNFKWAISQSISYVEILDAFNNIDQITKDLKIKLYRMNDIDSIILQKNKDILKSLNDISDEFIFKSRNFLIQRYKEFIKDEADIEMTFSPDVLKVIDSEIDKKESIIGEDYENMMKIYLRDNLISSYKKLLEEKTEVILRIINSNREYLKIILDDIYSLDPDDTLNEINNKINITSDSIEEYYNHFATFKIPSELVEYLYNYGKNEVQPLFENIQLLNNDIFKESILINVDKNSENYEKSYNYNAFNEMIKASYNLIKDDFILNLNESGHLYLDNYPERLNLKINDIALRRLDENYVRKIPDRYLAETFDKILNNSLNLKTFIKSLEKFEEFDKKIDYSINELNSAYKESKKLIEANNFTDDVKSNLNDKADYLKNHSLEYYSQINESFYNIKNYLNESISKLDELFNSCANITIETFEKKYEEIFKKVISINSLVKDKIEIFEKEEEVKTQNTQVTVKTTIENIQEDVAFKYNYQNIKNEMGLMKLPSLSTSIINLSRPQKLTIDIIKEITNCAKEIETIEVIFNNFNYSVSLYYSPDSQNIISNISGLFDDYEYTVERYNTSDTKTKKCIGNGYNTNIICFPDKCSNLRDSVLVPKYGKKNSKREFSIVGNIPEL